MDLAYSLHCIKCTWSYCLCILTNTPLVVPHFLGPSWSLPINWHWWFGVWTDCERHLLEGGCLGHSHSFLCQNFTSIFLPTKTSHCAYCMCTHCVVHFNNIGVGLALHYIRPCPCLWI